MKPLRNTVVSLRAPILRAGSLLQLAEVQLPRRSLRGDRSALARSFAVWGFRVSLSGCVLELGFGGLLGGLCKRGARARKALGFWVLEQMKSRGSRVRVFELA